MRLSLLLIIILLSVATINSLLLIVKPERSVINNKMLGWSLLFYNVFLLVYFVWFEAGYIIDAPHMFRSVSPLMYLSAPFFYFYIRNSIQGTKGLRNHDWIHFVPAFIHFFELMPFYLESREVKLAIVQQVVDNPFMINRLGYGLIPMAVHYPIRSFIQLCYLSASIYMVINLKPNLLFELGWKKLSNWLYISLLLMGIVIVAHAAYSFFEMLKNFGLLDWSNLIAVFSRLALFGILLLNLYINFNPDLVFAYKEQEKEFQIDEVTIIEQQKTEVIEEEDMNLDEEVIDKLSSISELDLLTVKMRIEHLIVKEQCFLQKGINLTQFSQKLGISSKLVSQVLRRYFEKGFNELINCYRDRYAIAEIQNGYLDDYTIDSLSEKAGFNSRITFFNAFKKEVGCSPNEYWKKFLNGQIEEEE